MAKPAKQRPALPSLRASEVLNDLDSFLSAINDEQEVEDTVKQQFYLGKTCQECKNGSEPPLLEAATKGHERCLREILAHEKNLDVTTIVSDNGTTAAHIAARRGDLESLRIVITFNESLCNIGDIRGATPLHVCAYHGHLDCLSFLIERNAAANCQDLDGATPIHFAAASGHLECLRQLVEIAGGNPNQQTNSGETPVYFAAQEGHLDCVYWLVEHANADPLISSNDGMTPLHAAAQTGRLNVTHWLVRSAKCPITSRTCDGATPVHFAAAKGHVAILEWMLNHHLATGHEQDDFGATPVHDAAEQGQLECLHVFYNHSVDLNQQDCEKLTPKDLAEERGHRECASFLSNPEKASQVAKKKNQATKLQHDAQLTLLITPKNEKDKPEVKTKKRKLFGGFKTKSKAKPSSSHTKL